MASRRGRVDPGKLRRDLRAYSGPAKRSWRDWAGVAGAVLIVVIEVGRVASASDRGTSGWDFAVLAGTVAGALGAVVWWVWIPRQTVAARSAAGVSALAWLAVVVTTTGTRTHPYPPLTGPYQVGAVTYAAIGLASAAVLLYRMNRR